MPWNDSTIPNAKNRIRQYDLDRRFDDISSGRVIPKIGDLRLGEARELGLAVMHVDMNNFKGLTKDLPNEQKLRLLNIYLSELTHIIRDHDGFVEKYVGDGITSLFGAGKDKETAVLDAAKCALTILTEIYYAINGYLKSIDLSMFSCSIGMDYGRIWVARTGVQGMNQLTLVGNEVSVAKQLEEFSGYHQIFIGHNTYSALLSGIQSFCIKQPDRDDFRWWLNNNTKYPFYHLNAYWPGYELV